MALRHLLASLALAAAALASSAAVAAAAGEPLVGATWATDVSATTASLHAEVDPNGSSTKYHFEYIGEAAYQANLAATPPREGFSGAARMPAFSEAGLGASAGEQEAFQRIATLVPNASYRYRVLATNAQSPPAGTPGPTRALSTQDPSPIPNLPDDRDWEMVSPVQKNGGAVQGVGGNSGGDVLQAAANGDALTYSSNASFAPGAQGAPPASQYLSRRGAGGWSTEDLTVALFSGSYGDAPIGVPYQLFSTGLDRGLMLNGQRCRGTNGSCVVVNPALPGSGAPQGYQDYYLRDNASGGFEALLTQANRGTLALAPEQFELSFAAASPDLRHVVLSTCAALTVDASEVSSGGGGCDPAEANLYEWSEGQLELINILPGHTQGTPGAKLAAQGAGAVSADGSRIYFTDEGNLYLREGAHTAAVDEGIGAGGEFQTASADGSVAFLSKGGELFRYRAEAEETTDLSAGAEVQGVLGASQDGSRLYYADANGLFLWSDGASVKVAAAADPSDYPPSTGTARLSPDGTKLLFLSKASLTGFDNTDQRTGQPDPEVYLYDANAGAGAGTLLCASCNPTAERPLGPSAISGAIPNGAGPTATATYKPRNLPTGPTRVFFDSGDALAARDSNRRQDVYEWEAQGTAGCPRAGGCISLISGAQSVEDSEFIDASSDGSDLFFLTDSSLVAQDPGSFDVYDAREGGGFPSPPAPIECDGDACQGFPTSADDPAVGTASPGAGGNPPLHFPKGPRAKPHHKKRHKQPGSHRRRGGKR